MIIKIDHVIYESLTTTEKRVENYIVCIKPFLNPCVSITGEADEDFERNL